MKLLSGLVWFLGAMVLTAGELAGVQRTEVIYGRKFGTALTLDVLRPATTNGFGVIGVISGGFFSSHDGINPEFFKAVLDRGYTVFAVVHGSQPRFTIPECAADLHRSVRFIRNHALEYGIRADKLGVFGASAAWLVGHDAVALAAVALSAELVVIGAAVAGIVLTERRRA